MNKKISDLSYEFNSFLGLSVKKHENVFNVVLLYPYLKMGTCCLTETNSITEKTKTVFVDFMKSLEDNVYYVRSTSQFACPYCGETNTKFSHDTCYSYNPETKERTKIKDHICRNKDCKKVIDSYSGRKFFLVDGLDNQILKKQITERIIENVKGYNINITKNDVHGSKKVNASSSETRISEQNKIDIALDINALFNGQRGIFGEGSYSIDAIDKYLEENSDEESEV